MIPIEILPHLNATLNTLSTIFILGGWYFIWREQKLAHAASMMAAIVTSTLFLGFYLYYHFTVGSVKFTHEGMMRYVYYAILLTHVVLAFAVPPLVVMTVIPALRARYDRHKKIAVWTLPIWLYVSVTGVIVYLFLYVWYPPENLYEILKQSGVGG